MRSLVLWGVQCQLAEPGRATMGRCKQPGARYYSDRASRSDKMLRLDVVRTVYQSGVKDLAPCVEATLEALAAGRVEATCGGVPVSRKKMELHEGWARGQLTRLAVGDVDARSRYQKCHNLMTNIMRRTFPAQVKYKVAVKLPVSDGWIVTVKGAPPSNGPDAVGKQTITPSVPASQPRGKKRDIWQVPERLEPLPEAPRLPTISARKRARVRRGEPVEGVWQTAHEWWKMPKSRPPRDRGEELDGLLRECDALTRARGWEAIPPNAATRAAVKKRAGTKVKGEAILSTMRKTSALKSDQLSRMTADHQLYAWKRQCVLYPEGHCGMLGLPMNHDCFAALAAAGYTAERVNWAISQGLAESQSSLLGDVAWAVTDAAGEGRVKAEFRGAGLNTVAMVWDVEKGRREWDMMATYEAAPGMAEMCKVAWQGRVGEVFERAEEPSALPPGARVNTSFVSLQCQCWCWANVRGYEKMDKATDERWAVYQQMKKNQPNVIFDEMLSRAHMCGKRQAWERVEYVREQALPDYCWFLVECEAGKLPKAFMRSHREIAIGVLPQYKVAVRRILESQGYRRVDRKM